MFSTSSGDVRKTL